MSRDRFGVAAVQLPSVTVARDWPQSLLCCVVLWSRSDVVTQMGMFLGGVFACWGGPTRRQNSPWKHFRVFF